MMLHVKQPFARNVDIKGAFLAGEHGEGPIYMSKLSRLKREDGADKQH